MAIIIPSKSGFKTGNFNFLKIKSPISNDKIVRISPNKGVFNIVIFIIFSPFF